MDQYVEKTSMGMSKKSVLDASLNGTIWLVQGRTKASLKTEVLQSEPIWNKTRTYKE